MATIELSVTTIDPGATVSTRFRTHHRTYFQSRLGKLISNWPELDHPAEVWVEFGVVWTE